MCGKHACSLGFFIVSRSPDYCSEFVHTMPADPYLSEASLHCVDQPYIHAHLC